MPLYEYKCKECGIEYEELVSMSVTQTPPCPGCASNNVEKKMSACAKTGLSGASSGGSCGASGFS